MKPGWYVLENGTKRVIVGPFKKEVNANSFCKSGYYVHEEKETANENVDRPSSESTNGTTSGNTDSKG